LGRPVRNRLGATAGLGRRGLVTSSSRAATLSFSSSLFMAKELTAMIGIAAVSSSALVCPIASWPSSTGSRLSLRRRSGYSEAALATPSAPSAASITVCSGGGEKNREEWPADPSGQRRQGCACSCGTAGVHCAPLDTAVPQVRRRLPLKEAGEW